MRQSRSFFSLFLFRLLPFHLHERVAELEMADFMDLRLFVDPLPVGINGARGAADQFCALTGAEASCQRVADLELLGAEPGIAGQKVLIVLLIQLFFSQIGQTADLHE